MISEELATRRKDDDVEDTIQIRASDLWENTFCRGRPHSDVEKLRDLGNAHLATAEAFRRGAGAKEFECLPTYKMFLGETYDKFTGSKERGREFALEFLGRFYNIFQSIRKNGYNPAVSRIAVDKLYGRYYLTDGHRRLASIMVLSPDEEIEVTLTPMKYWRDRGKKLIKKILGYSSLGYEGKYLYQPVYGYKRYSYDDHRNRCERALSLIINSIGEVKGKRILDVGSCFGYYSFGLVRKGAFITAIDIRQDFILLSNILRRLQRFCWSNPCFLEGDIASYALASKKKYDAVLMLNFFHNLYEQMGGNAFRVLDAIASRARNIILSMGHQGICKSQAEIPEFIVSNSKLRSYEVLGSPLWERHIIKFEV